MIKRKYHLLILILIQFAIVNCKNPETLKSDSSNRQEFVNSEDSLGIEKNTFKDDQLKEDDLKSLYEKAFTGSRSDSLKYLTAFPEDYKGFVSLFGYENDTYAQLYEDSHFYIALFCSCAELDKGTFYNKVISLSMDSYWQADGVAHLQNCIRNRLAESDTELLRELSFREMSYQEDFWKFVFSGPTISEEDFKEIVGSLPAEGVWYQIARKSFLENSSID